MKRLIILFCVFMIYAAASAQNIVQAEYFVNDDPGYGNATDIPVSPGTDVTLNFIANTAGLEKGVHTLFIRAKDDNGAWSTVVNRYFLLGNYPLDPLLTIVQAEYFIDEDPGHGEGTTIFFDENEGVTEKSFVVNLDGVEVGTHMLYIRVLDENGHWSITYAEPFEVEMPLIIADFSANITEGSIPLPVQFTDETYISEPHTWFWDFGDGNTSTLQNPQHTYSEPGEYTVSLTATSDDGTDTETKVDYITVYPPPFTLEYFFNDDPGYGNGNQVYDYSSLVGGFDFNIPVDELELGLNILFFRAVDILGHWSQTYSRTFIKTRLLSDPWPHIMAAEYFFDEDPGYGLGSELPVTPGTTGEIEVLIPLEDLTHGWHTVCFRSKDQNGHWSHTHCRTFLKLFIPDDPVSITHLEYFIDEDPGVGNGTPVEITPGDHVEQSFIIYPGAMPPGEYTLYVRAKDDRGSWSIVFNQVFEVEPFTGCPPPNTLTADNVTTNAATLGWNPGSTETQWELLWGLNGFNPETEGILIQNIVDNTYLLEGLSPATNYDFYVKAVCDDGVSEWAGPATFTTEEEQIIDLPTVQTTEADEITETTATSGGNITNDGGAPVTVRGVVWSTTENPTVETNEGITYDGAGTGSWVSELAGLTPDTEYFVRAYATNSGGTAYGNEVSFTTLEDHCTPGWIPGSHYQYNMQVIGQLYLHGEPANDPNHVLGAFVDGECRGVASPDPNLMGLVYLTVGSDLLHGETVDFLIWDADACQECATGVSMIFENQQQIGLPGNPYPFDCGEHELSLSFGEGYTWFSVNIDPGSMLLNNLFEPLSPCDEDRILGQNSFATYYDDQWVGSLTEIAPSWMHKMQLCSQQTMTIPGQPVANDPVTLGAGYTWLGYLPQGGLTINYALANITPEPVEDNRLLGQNSFAVYYEGQWIGSLKQLHPGSGYIAELSSHSVLQYPYASKKDAPLPEPELFSPTGERPLANKQYSMMLIAQLELPDGSISANPDDVIYAYAGSECRGMAVPVREHDGAIFMAIGSNAQIGEEISFKAWLADEQFLFDVNERISFESLKKAGDMRQPVLLTLTNVTGINDGMVSGVYIGEPFPNPFSESTEIAYRLPVPAQVRLSIYDARGQKLRTVTDAAMPDRLHKTVIQRDGLQAGVYFYRMEVFVDGEMVQKNGKIIIVH